MKPQTLNSLWLIAAVGSAAVAAPTFSPATAVPTGQRPAGVAFADFDGDGDTDLAVTSDNLDKIEIYSNTAGSLALSATYFTGAGTGADDLIASDVDGDGDADLVVVLKNTNSVQVYSNTAGLFTAGASTLVGAEPIDLSIGDVDGDGDDDFVTANRDGASFTVLTNTAGALSATSFPGGVEPRSTAIGDFTGDGVADIAVSEHDGRSVNIHSGAAGYAVAQGLGVNPIARPDGVVAADFNGDGLMDLAAAVSDDLLNVASVWLNTGASMGPRTDFPTGGANVGGIAAADLDGDGDTDLVTTHQDSNSMSTLDNSGTGIFAAGVVSPAGARPGNIAFGDIDGNGGSDIVIANRDGNDVSVYMNQNGMSGPCSVVDIAEPFGQLNFLDVSAYLDAFSMADLSADLNADGSLNFLDISAFIATYSAGCP
jgi:hypothetical protein